MQQLQFFSLQETFHQKDFLRFHNSFQKRVVNEIPGIEEVHFLTRPEDIPRCIPDDNISREIEAFFADPQSDKRLFHADETSLVITIATDDGDTLILATGVDDYFCRHVSSNWLKEMAARLENGFRQIVSSGTDIETGLLNSRQFFFQLGQMVHDSPVAALLLELYPRARSSWEAEQHKKRAVRALDTLLCPKDRLCYLGNHLYGILMQVDEGDAATKTARRILAKLRRDGFRKIHIGLRRMESQSTAVAAAESQEIYNQLEYTLRTARARGPFAICDYQRLRHPEKHPLKKPSKRIVSKFRRRYQKCDSFSIVLFSEEGIGEQHAIQEAAGSLEILSDGEDVYLFFPESTPEEALTKTQKVLAGAGLHDIRIGIAGYPYNNFSRNQVLLNCRKALRHADFYGPGGYAIFDALSLNISGDIYYAEGDVASSVKEYRAGLLCCPADVNLLNSLGVAYADMNRHKDAAVCFQEVLAIDPVNFMALYNAGLGAELRNKSTEAIGYFEKAYSLETDFGEAKNDLAFHLGRLHCTAGNYTRSLELLLAWYRGSSHDLSRGKALLYIGKAYHGLKQYDNASLWLQKALRYDEFDGEALVLLGHSYQLSGQGNEVALSLCRRGVELAAENGQFRLYLAEVEIACKLHDKVRETLIPCLRKKQTRTHAQMLMLQNYREEKVWSRVRFYLHKLKENNSLNDDVKQQLADIEGEVNDI